MNRLVVADAAIIIYKKTDETRNNQINIYRHINCDSSNSPDTVQLTPPTALTQFS